MHTHLKKFLCVATLAASSLVHAGFEQCSQFFPDARPPHVTAGAHEQRELCFDSFAVLHSGESKTPVYAVQRLNRALLQAAQSEPRVKAFHQEKTLPKAHRASQADYAGAQLHGQKYVMGHMAPAADMPTFEAGYESFSLANMVPQAARNNSPTWSGIERATRKYVMRAKADVFVFTGPVFTGQIQTIGKRRVWVPSHLFKLVYDPLRNQAWAHWLENTDEARVGKPISYAELVRRTGIEFLPGRRPQDPPYLD